MSNIGEFLLLSTSDSESITTSITCYSDASLTFVNIGRVQVNELEFIRCGICNKINVDKVRQSSPMGHGVIGDGAM